MIFVWLLLSRGGARFQRGLCYSPAHAFAVLLFSSVASRRSRFIFTGGLSADACAREVGLNAPCRRPAPVARLGMLNGESSFNASRDSVRAFPSPRKALRHDESASARVGR